MTERLELFCDLTADEGRRVIVGRVVRAGETGRTSRGPALFASPTALAWPADLSRVKLLRDHDAAQPVGYATAVDVDDQDVVATFRVPEGPAGDQALTEAANHLRDGLSVGVAVTESTRDSDGTLRVTASTVREVSQVALPAYDDARVLDVAAAEQPEEDTMTAEPLANADLTADDTPADADRPVVDLHQLQAAATPQLPEPPTTLDLDGICDLAAAVNRQEADQVDLQAALTDVKTGDASAFVRPQYVNDLVNLVERGRPLVNRAATRRNLPPTGMAIDRPRWATLPSVGVQATEKTDVTSSAVSIVLDRKNVVTIAGGNDVSVQAVERSSPSLMRELVRAYAEQYSRETESATYSAMNDGTTGAGTLTAPATVDALSIVTTFAEATIAAGFSLDWLAFGPGTLQYLVALKAVDGPAFWGGAVSTRTGDGNLGGVDAFPGWAMGNHVIMGGSREGVSFYETAGSPFQLRAVQAAKLGVDISVFGYHAIDSRYGRDNAMHIGYYKMDVTPAGADPQPPIVVPPDECDDEGWPTAQKAKAKK